MNTATKSDITKSLKASSITNIEVLQELWSGYGEICRLKLEGAKHQSVIVKNISLPDQLNHPRGWNSNNSHQRKLKSYEVEWYWYQQYAHRCGDGCRLPQHISSKQAGIHHYMVMEDLNAAGYPLRKSRLSYKEVQLCLSWLACFHATFMGESPKGLWESGTYWHLATRPDELKVMTDGKLKDKARLIDNKLNNCHYQSFVHGDAKVANFCFAEDIQSVAAVDFQYVGGGCGMKDVIYLLGSCLSDEECELYESDLLDFYFSKLSYYLNKIKPEIDTNKVEEEWRGLYALAWTDFTRFLLGWMPTHKKINGYSLRLMEEALSELNIKFS